MVFEGSGEDHKEKESNLFIRYFIIKKNDITYGCTFNNLRSLCYLKKIKI